MFMMKGEFILRSLLRLNSDADMPDNVLSDQ